MFDLSAFSAQAGPTLDARNAYFRILAAYPAYRYAYDLQTSLDGALLRCEISYMPYRTGNYPAGFEGETVDSLAGLMRTARAHLDQPSIPIRITQPSLAVDDMARALQQVGGGICCARSTATPQPSPSRRKTA